jgi:nucleoside-diphosphate kinase
MAEGHDAESLDADTFMVGSYSKACGPRKHILNRGRTSPQLSKGLHIRECVPTGLAMAHETSLILLKPDAIEKNLAGTVLARFQSAGFTIRGIKMMQLDDAILREHYSHISDKPFFPEIVSFMSKTPVIALALAGDDVIAKVRDLLGPTDSKAAAAGTIRGDFGEDKMVNVCHASDSPEAAAAELKRFFGDGEVF